MQQAEDARLSYTQKWNGCITLSLHNHFCSASVFSVSRHVPFYGFPFWDERTGRNANMTMSLHFQFSFKDATGRECATLLHVECFFFLFSELKWMPKMHKWNGRITLSLHNHFSSASVFSVGGHVPFYGFPFWDETEDTRILFLDALADLTFVCIN